MSTKAEQLEWRRSKVIELRARGLTYMEIARELQMPKTTVAEDMLYLRKRAKESIKEYVTEYLPEQYQICLNALDTILKHSYEILQTSDDNHEKISALELYKDTHLEKLNLLSNAITIEHALNHINSSKAKALSNSQSQPPQLEEQAKQEQVF